MEEGEVDFDQLEAEVDNGNRFIWVAHDQSGEITIENPFSMLYHEVLGLLYAAIDVWDDGDDEEDDDLC